MFKKKQAKATRLLTPVELELMGILWKRGEGTVADVMGDLPAARKLAYTSVSTMLRILEQKKIVGSRREGRGHVYFPVMPKHRYEMASLDHLVAKVFDGAPSSVVRKLLETDGLSESDLRSIRALIDGKLKES